MTIFVICVGSSLLSKATDVTLQKTQQITDHRHEAKLPIQISHLSAQVQVFRKSLDFRVFRIIFTILTSLCHELNH